MVFFVIYGTGKPPGILNFLKGHIQQGKELANYQYFNVLQA